MEMPLTANRISTARARMHLKNLVGEAQFRKNRAIITRHNEDVAALVPMTDLLIIDYLIIEGKYEEQLEKAKARAENT